MIKKYHEQSIGIHQEITKLALKPSQSEANKQKIEKIQADITTAIAELRKIYNECNTMLAAFRPKKIRLRSDARRLIKEFESLKVLVNDYAKHKRVGAANVKPKLEKSADVPPIQPVARKSKPKVTKPKTIYKEYIQSDKWRAKANEAKKRADQRCQVCNRHRRQVQLDAHHRTYERLGDELPSDITVLCRDCHELYESEKRLKSQKMPCRHCGTLFIPAQAFHIFCNHCASKSKQCSKCKRRFVPPKAYYHTCRDCFNL